MTPELWLAYTTTLVIYMSTPGPSHLLMLSNSLSSGFPRSIATAAGDLTANTVQIVVASLGLVSLIAGSREVFIYIKWAGVAYLVFLGVSLIRRQLDAQLATRNSPQSRGELYWQGFVTSASNPKAIIFFAALFPQFVNPQSPPVAQFAVLGMTFLLVDGAFLLGYGHFANWVSDRFDRYVGQHMNRVSGVLLIIAALLLGLRDIDTAVAG
ncbi:MAG: LysE family translocator [Gammaproteobacteria bacterium]|nr:LysE family translocator [Gammaproteobacteria bacterium]